MQHVVSQTILFSGHMTDAHDRAKPRFPEAQAPLARAAIDAALIEMAVAPGARCICGGARGGDLLFAEAGLARGANVELFLPLPEPAFLDASVRTDVGDPDGWVQRFDNLCAQKDLVTVYPPSDDPATDPLFAAHALPAPANLEGLNPFARNNRRMLAWAQVHGPWSLMVLWDGSAGDGPGGTVDMVETAQKTGAPLIWLRPQDL